MSTEDFRIGVSSSLRTTKELEPSTVCKKFDLIIGDKISFISDTVDETEYYTVVKIYPYIFKGVDKNGKWRTLSKAQYISGEVRKVKYFGENYQVVDLNGRRQNYGYDKR